MAYKSELNLVLDMVGLHQSPLGFSVVWKGMELKHGRHQWEVRGPNAKKGRLFGGRSLFLLTPAHARANL